MRLCTSSSVSRSRTRQTPGIRPLTVASSLPGACPLCWLAPKVGSRQALLQVRAVAVAPDKLHRGVTDRTAGVEALPQVSDPVKERPLLDGVEIGPVLRAALSTVGS